MRLVIYTQDGKTICKVKPKELLEFNFEGCIFVDVKDNLVDTGIPTSLDVQHLFSHTPQEDYS